MDHLYALYDALISIAVPQEKARAVVEAMERDVAGTLATRADLQLLGTELRQELRHESAAIRKDVDLLRKDLDLLRNEVDLKISNATLRLGSITTLGLGVLFAALKLT